MSQSSVSSGSAVDRHGQALGIPKKCHFCDRGVTLRVSTSESNPHRRYYRCDFAYELKLRNDRHLFKWLDNALLEEVGILSLRNDELQKDISDFWLLMKDNDDRVQGLAMETKKEIKKMKLMMVAVVFLTFVIAKTI